MEDTRAVSPRIRRIRHRWSSAPATAIRSSASGRIAQLPTIRRTAREIWRVSYDDGFSNVPRPVFGQGLVFIATGFQQPALIAVRPDGTGDVTRSHVAWTLRRGAPYTPSPILVGEQLFIVNDAGIATSRRREDRRDPLAAAPGRQLLRLARVCRRPDLFPERGRRDHGDRTGHDVQAPGDEPAGRRHAGVDGGGRAVVLHQDAVASVSDWR